MTNDTSKVKKQPSKTNWNKVISQTDAEIQRNVKDDPDSPVLNNNKYYKPGKTNTK